MGNGQWAMGNQCHLVKRSKYVKILVLIIILFHQNEVNMMDNQACNFYKSLIEHIQSIMFSESFKSCHRINDRCFIRMRSLTFVNTILLILNMLKRSLQDEIDEFFRALNRGESAERLVTKGAFSLARKKLKHTAFVELNREQTAYFYTHGDVKTWHGMRLLAIDGSMSELPNTAEIRKHFGVWHPQSGGECPKARLSQLYDVLNHVTIDALITPKDEDERSLANRHFEHLTSTDLVLLDRGYPAYWIFKRIRSTGAHFCARLSVDNWTSVREFAQSGQTDAIVTLSLPQPSRKLCLEHGLSDEPITLRLIRVVLPDESEIILATSLLDQDTFPADIFGPLYWERWSVETDYRRIKIRFEVENWSGKSVEAVCQDFHAAIFAKNFSALLVGPAQQVVAEQSKTRKHPYRINMTNLISKMKDTLVLLFKRDRITHLLKRLWQQMITTIEPVRPGRKYERKKKITRKRYKSSYKSTR
jgi:hypothetical protein